MMDYLPIFVGVTAAAVVLQACILVAMYLAMRQSSARIEALASEVKTKILPTADTVQATLVELRPKIDSIVSNVNETSEIVRGQIARLDATVSDTVDRARLQVIRADELLTRTMDHVEETTELVHNTVISPVRKLAGLMQGLNVGFDALLAGRRRRRNTASVPQDEMFI
jgi:hypothetical protein